MSNAMAIASVTAVLKNMLDNGVIDDQVTSTVGSVTVSALAPDLVPVDSNAASRLNLFMYLATPNAAWRNVGLPSRDAAGERRTNPPLALDLHYFLTAYAARDLHAEILLGFGMQVLHETPVLSRQGIRRALGVPNLVDDPLNALPPALEMLSTSGLAEQVEAIKIVPDTLGPDEMSKLWAGFQSHYRPTAFYHASVTLIEAERPTRAPLPVRARKLFVVPFREPVIERVLAQPQESPATAPRADVPILARDLLAIRGRQLKGPRVSVRIGGLPAPDPLSVEDAQVIVPLLGDIEAGVRSVQVVHEQLLGEPPVPHAGVASNLLAFVLHPEIVSPPSLVAADLVRVRVEPPIGERQRVVLLLNERLVIPSPPVGPIPVPRAYSFVATRPPAGSPSAPVSQIDVRIAGVAAGTYLVRVQVDGADSPLGTDESGAFDSPSLVIP
jgi:Pvc16 N-terminal domain